MQESVDEEGEGGEEPVAEPGEITLESTYEVGQGQGRGQGELAAAEPTQKLWEAADDSLVAFSSAPLDLIRAELHERADSIGSRWFGRTRGSAIEAAVVNHHQPSVVRWAISVLLVIVLQKPPQNLSTRLGGGPSPLITLP